MNPSKTFVTLLILCYLSLSSQAQTNFSQTQPDTCVREIPTKLFYSNEIKGHKLSCSYTDFTCTGHIDEYSGNQGIVLPVYFGSGEGSVSVSVQQGKMSVYFWDESKKCFHQRNATAGQPIEFQGSLQASPMEMIKSFQLVAFDTVVHNLEYWVKTKPSVMNRKPPTDTYLCQPTLQQERFGTISGTNSKSCSKDISKINCQGEISKIKGFVKHRLSSNNSNSGFSKPLSSLRTSMFGAKFKLTVRSGSVTYYAPTHMGCYIKFIATPDHPIDEYVTMDDELILDSGDNEATDIRYNVN